MLPTTSSPMNGGICQSSTRIFTSVLGLETLNTFSPLLKVPLSPVAASILAVSIGAFSSANAGDKNSNCMNATPRTATIRFDFCIISNSSYLFPAARLLLLDDHVVGHAVAWHAQRSWTLRPATQTSSGIIGERRLDTELALFDRPLGDNPATQVDNSHRAVAHVLFGKMCFVGNLHARDLGLDLRVGQFAVSLCGDHGLRGRGS